MWCKAVTSNETFVTNQRLIMWVFWPRTLSHETLWKQQHLKEKPLWCISLDSFSNYNIYFNSHVIQVSDLYIPMKKQEQPISEYSRKTSSFICYLKIVQLKFLAYHITKLYRKCLNHTFWWGLVEETVNKTISTCQVQTKTVLLTCKYVLSCLTRSHIYCISLHCACLPQSAGLFIVPRSFKCRLGGKAFSCLSPLFWNQISSSRDKLPLYPKGSIWNISLFWQSS